MSQPNPATESPCAETLADLTAEILARCEVLGFATEEVGRLTRTFLSPPMQQVHALVAGWMAEAGMTVRLDPIGNLIGRYPGQLGGATDPAILIGSHLDTVPDAGKYDGVLGVLLGVAAVRALNRAGRRLPCAVEVVGFVEEEGVRYRTPFLGSLALAGRFDPAWLGLADAEGVTMADTCHAFGLDPAEIGAAAAPPGRYRAYLEPHIEQGPVLAAAGRPLGIVTAIAGQSRLVARFEGQAGHAGTTPMDHRRDALPAAAELVLAVETLARSVDGLRGTVGTLAPTPGAGNVIPGSVTLSLDIRHASDPIRERAVADLRAKAERIAAERGLAFAVVATVEQAAVPAAPEITRMLAAAIAEVEVDSFFLVSGAGHDAAIMASVAPMGMLFVRSPNGISHHPAEQVDPTDVRVALDVLGRWLIALAG